ncbi:MAG: hypothetical protein CME35_04290 [Gramella sp.]|nr:hypothetical protein [Christiangramia sp.]|tara:strand:- start:530 stop:811 length:282 start_codon:yes stop_codon:yes gene_type:complete
MIQAKKHIFPFPVVPIIWWLCSNYSNPLISHFSRSEERTPFAFYNSEDIPLSGKYLNINFQNLVEPMNFRKAGKPFLTGGMKDLLHYKIFQNA